MSKELEALELLYEDMWGVPNEYQPHKMSTYDNCKEIIESALKDLEWLKSKLDIDFMNRLSVPEDKIRLLKIMGLEVKINE